MYVDTEKYRERSLVQNIEDIQLKTILLYRDSQNMPETLLKELTFALTNVYEFLYTGVVKDNNYKIVNRILEDLTTYMKNRLLDKYTMIDEYELPSDVVQLKHVCNMAEDKLLGKNIDGLYDKEIEFIRNYKLYLLNLAYFLVF
jgi:hypothetical protein